MHSFIKRLSLAFALLLFVSAIVFVNLAFAKSMKDSLLDIFNNVFCTFVGVFAVFDYKNNLNDKYWHVNDNGIIVCTINGVVEFKVQLNEGGKQSV